MEVNSKLHITTNFTRGGYLESTELEVGVVYSRLGLVIIRKNPNNPVRNRTLVVQSATPPTKAAATIHNFQ
jgi:hypothetical protein